MNRREAITVPIVFRSLLVAFALMLPGSWCLAQQFPQNADPTRVNPRGLTSAPQQQQQQGTPPSSTVPPVSVDQATTNAAALLNQQPGESTLMFGGQLFQPGATPSTGVSFNPGYVLAIGDRVVVRLWGAFNYESVEPIDPQGNVFIPNVGPVRLAGVRNSDLNDVVRAAVGKVYRNNVDVYASLEASQPVRVFVTGFVRAPGQYGGLAAESVLGYLSRAGGIDPERGSYIDIQLMRDGEVRATFNLYDFLLEGRLDPVQLHDGDTIVVSGRHNAVRVTGDVFNAYGFEFVSNQIAAADILKLARPKPGATHVSVVHKVGIQQVAEYHPIGQLEGVMLSAGDELSVVSDRTVATILVRVDGAIDSSRVLTLPYGSRLSDALALVKPKPEARIEAVQLFRNSVKERQREMLEVSLRLLETAALTARSATSEEAALRTQEAALVTRFVERARAVEPKGQVVLGDRSTAMSTLLEDGDVLYVPEESSIVMVHGEVTLPSAIAYDPRSSVSDYVRLAGGTVNKDSASRILLIRQDGTVVEDTGRAWYSNVRPKPGDEILVLPKVETKSIEVTRGITQILYQLAIAAKVALDL